MTGADACVRRHLSMRRLTGLELVIGRGGGGGQVQVGAAVQGQRPASPRPGHGRLGVVVGEGDLQVVLYQGAGVLKVGADVSGHLVDRRVAQGPSRLGGGVSRAASLAGPAAVARTFRAGTYADDRQTTLRVYLLRWLEAQQLARKQRTYESYAEACHLYWIPALGHVRLTALREQGVRDAHKEMRKLNRPAEDGDKSEMLRRLAAARAVVPPC